ncbi:AfsR/SARP family transcriptional regulator [Terrabacter sp. 2RAF25]|uniref:AfsR/SARP family transcriptional regulator n=1 Tax=Terrabacter sp. 2RAF25 TaxID=3232998 RepID=UPI003F980FAC
MSAVASDAIDVHEAIAVQLLGGVSVRVDDREMGPRDIGGTKIRHLLLALLFADGVPVPKDELISMLWPGDRGSACGATLETYICLLRKRLRPVGAPRWSPIETGSGCYRLDADVVDLDLHRHRRLVERALSQADTEAALAQLRSSLSQLLRPFLPGEGDAAWLEDARWRHGRQVRAWLVAAAEKVVDVAPADAATWARAAVELDPLDESAWWALLRSAEVQGRHADGLRSYEQCRRHLADELGCQPGPRLQEIYTRLLGGPSETAPDLAQLIESVICLYVTIAGDVPTQMAGLPTALDGGGPSIEDARRNIDALLRGLSRADTVAPPRTDSGARPITRGRRPVPSVTNSQRHTAVLTR